MKHHSAIKGIATPLSYLRDKNTLGIGNISSLKSLIDFCKSKKIKIIQLLPINDSGETNLWPYSSISSYAINPIYIDINQVQEKYQHQLNAAQSKKIARQIKTAAQEETANLINYAKVRKNIVNILKSYFTILEPTLSQEIAEFTAQYPWVLDYALFMVISTKYKNKPWLNWPESLKEHNQAALTEFYQENKQEIDFWIFTQILALHQLIGIKNYAHEKGIFIKGDIPILTSRSSADVWANQHYFLLDYGAGAPPDMFSTGGQEWGNPPLNVNNRNAIDYFISRFNFAENYLDYVRIDHVLGLFRLLIWPLNQGNLISNGFFYPQISKENNVTISRTNLEYLGINPEQFTKLEGVLTDAHDLGPDLCAKLVSCGFAKYLKGQEKIAWIQDQKLKENSVELENLSKYQHNLYLNEDYFRSQLQTADFTSFEISLVLKARRRLLNMLCPYFDAPDYFAFTFYGKETWQYLNLQDKSALNNLLDEQRKNQYAFWQDHGENFLTALQNKTKLKLFAEDLGLVDDYMPETLKALNIPGINIIRWSKSFKLEDQRELAVLTSSTHDTSSFTTWWQKEADLEVKTRFVKEFLERDFVDVDLNLADTKNIFERLNKAPSKYVIIPLWEILHLWHNEPDIRINTPGISDSINWCSRMTQSIPS
ncbi:MAG: 4-alpha-glucanotransferase [Candidatus Margulisiibacteriota bacterium]|jgi:4-alpha-glucanotransferase